MEIGNWELQLGDWKFQGRGVLILLRAAFWEALRKVLLPLALVAGLSLATEAMPPRPGNTTIPSTPLASTLRTASRFLNVPPPRPAPRVGPGQVLVLCADFPDQTSNHVPSRYDRLLFADSAGTMYRYFDESSYGRLQVRGSVSDWVRLSQTYDFYVSSGYGVYELFPHNAQRIVLDAVMTADPAVDFSQYDNDGPDGIPHSSDDDGFVDALFVIHAGPGAEETYSPHDIWSHAWRLSDTTMGSPGAYLTQDGVWVDAYAMEPEEFFDGSLISVGVFCHEYGHLLGLPDLYAGGLVGGGPVVGVFDLMDIGAWNGEPPASSPAYPSVWCKYLLGWVEPAAVERASNKQILSASIPAIEDQARGYRILENPGGADWAPQGSGRGEYFLVENRQAVGFDQALPGTGLVIWHVDETQPDNTDPTHRLLAVMRADGSESSSTVGEAADPWSLNAAGFSNTSVPSSRFWSGHPSGAAVRNIGPSGVVMNADLQAGLVVCGEALSFPNPFKKRSPGELVTISYLPCSTLAFVPTGAFRVRLVSLSGEQVRLLDGPREVDPRSYQAFWDGKNDTGHEVASGIYYYLIEAGGEIFKGKLTFIH